LSGGSRYEPTARRIPAFAQPTMLPAKLDSELRYVSEWTVLGAFRILARTFAGLYH
jgi:hypothetical protein